MHTIEVDFDVFKALTARRASEAVTNNDVLRQMFGLGQTPHTASAAASSAVADLGDWVAKGVRFPAGTEFRASYKGQTILGKVSGGTLRVNGEAYTSPSAAAVAITSNPVNGWVFWECRTPGASSWRIIKSMRRRS